jgi:hypothetical protein
MTSQIDIARLEKMRRHGRKITARCPACAAEGGDRQGNHFFLNTETGQFGCAKYPSDKIHRQEIFRLVGIRGERDPIQEREWRRQRSKEATITHRWNRVSATIKANRNQIAARFAWTSSQAKDDSPQQDLEAFNDPRLFLASLFSDDAIIWTGNKKDSGQDGRYAARWKTISDWQAQPIANVGPMVSPAVWPMGTDSRSGNNVSESPYVILDFDGFDGIDPTTPDEIRDHLQTSMALVRWFRESLDWQLAALIYTGNKSLHAWFHTPSPEALESLKRSAKALGIDPGLIGHPEHPCRLPGWPHAKTGKISQVIWLGK